MPAARRPARLTEQEDRGNITTPDSGDLNTAARRYAASRGWAMPDGSYPIRPANNHGAADLRRAVRAVGRGGGSHNAIRRHIIRRARALGMSDQIPDSWGSDGSIRESTQASNRGEHMHLRETTAASLSEAAVSENGRVLLRLIAPGWSANGRYYSPEVLRRDGPGVFREGTHTYLDHPTRSEQAERPERSVRDLVGALVENSYWDPNGPVGPGVYARASVREDYRPLVDDGDLAEVIGMSIRADGTGHHGEAEGRQGTIIDTIESADSVDYVTSPAAGGRIVQLIESVQNPDRETTPLDEARNAADWIEVEIHRGVLGLANRMWENGYLTREEWQAVAAATNEAMDRFRASLVAARPDLLTRDPLMMPGAEPSPVNVAESADGTPPPAQPAGTGEPPAGEQPPATEDPPADPAGPTADPSAPSQVQESSTQEGDMTGTPGAGTAPLSTVRQRIENELANERRARALAEAREQARAVLARAFADAWVPPATVHRLTESLLSSDRLPLTESRQLNEPELLRLAQADLEQAETEMSEALAAAGLGRPRDLGYSSGTGAPYGPAAEQTRTRIEESFQRLGMTPERAKRAARGRA